MEINLVGAPLPKSWLCKYPDIVDFGQIWQSSKDGKDYVVSIMKFADGTQTKCIIDLEEGSNDIYNAFTTCYCKRVLGGDFNKTWKYWIETHWKNKLKETEKRMVAEAEAKEIAQRKRERAERKKFKRMVKQKELELRVELEALRNIGVTDEG